MNDGEQASDVLHVPGNKCSELAVKSLLDCLRAPLARKGGVRENLAAIDSHHRKQPCPLCLPEVYHSIKQSILESEFTDEKLKISDVDGSISPFDYQLRIYKPLSRIIGTFWGTFSHNRLSFIKGVTIFLLRKS